MSPGLDDVGAAPRSAASRRASCAATKTCWSMNCDRSFAWFMTWRVSCSTYRPEMTATTSRTSEAVARVNLFFRLNDIFSRSLVLFQLIVQRFETDAEEFGGASFVLVGGVESLENQFPFGGLDSSAGRETKAGKFVCLRHGTAREAFRQVLASDGTVIAGDGSALEDIAKLTHVSRPRISFEKVHHFGIHSENLAAVLLIHFAQ